LKSASSNIQENLNKSKIVLFNEKKEFETTVKQLKTVVGEIPRIPFLKKFFCLLLCKRKNKQISNFSNTKM